MGDASTSHVIHDVAYDFFGRRVAVCSSDQSIKIYDDSKLTAEWKAHSGSIWRIVWAHPEFGQVLASCSFDRKICIWEEVADTEQPTRASNGAWRLMKELTDARDSLNHLAFAPKQRGLLLASCSADRKVRVHEAPDPMDLSSWGLLGEFEAGDAGSRDCAATAPLCLAWNPRSTDPLMLVTGMTDGRVIMWRQSEGGAGWARLLEFESAPADGALARPLRQAHADRVHDLGWAPEMGRSFHVIATASRDRTVKVWSMKNEAVPAGLAAQFGKPAEDGGDGGDGSAAVEEKWVVKFDSELPHHSQVWRCSWSVTGSLLATSVDDGTMHVYRQDGPHSWEQVSFIEPQAQAQDVVGLDS